MQELVKLTGPASVPLGPSSIENDAHGIEKLLLKTQVSWTSLCKNLFNLLEFIAEVFRCHVHHFQCLTVPVELNQLIQHIIVQDQDRQNNNMCLHTFTYFWLRKTSVIVKTYQLSSCVFLCAFHSEISFFSVRILLFLCYAYFATIPFHVVTLIDFQLLNACIHFGI